MKPLLIVITILSCIGAVSGSILLLKNNNNGQEDSEQSIENFYMNELIKASIENECIEVYNSTNVKLFLNLLPGRELFFHLHFSFG